MYKRFILLILLLLSFLCFSNVYATNDVDYKLTITSDFKFIEEINYSLTNYKKITNGYNYFNSIVNDDIYTDIFYKTKYDKTKKKEKDKYLVTLKHTYNEYTFSNSLLLNNCFVSSDYKYDTDKYTFNGSDGFNCLYGDSLKITIVSDFENVSNNAIADGNSYVWNPVDDNFTMNIVFNKKYERKESNGAIGYDDIVTEENDELEESVDQTSSEQEEHHINKYVVLGVVGVLIIVGFGVVTVLKSKNNDLNKI